MAFLDAPSISIRGCVRPSVRPSVGPSVRPSRFRKNRWKWRYAVMQLCSYALCSARRILCRVYGLVFLLPLAFSLFSLAFLQPSVASCERRSRARVLYRILGMGRGNDAKTALGVIKETKWKIIKNCEIFLSLENYSSKSICSRALWLAPLERELSKLVWT